MNKTSIGLGIIRIITGAMMAYHGWEVFDATKMKEYASWPQIKNLPLSLTMVYTAKVIQLVTGLCFIMGLFTKAASILMAGVMLFVCFYIGNGRFYYEDQHPFIFALLALIFFFIGPGMFALDNTLNKKSKTIPS